MIENTEKQGEKILHFKTWRCWFVRTKIFCQNTFMRAFSKDHLRRTQRCGFL